MTTYFMNALKLVIGWMTLFVVGIDLFVVSPVLPELSVTFHKSVSLVGWMVSVFSIAYVFAAPWMGSLGDRYGRRQIIFVGLIGFGAANLMTSFSISLTMLLISRFIAGFAAAAITPSTYAIAGEAAPFNQRGGWLAIVGSGLLMALWLGAPTGSVIAHIYGWPSIFILLAIFSAILSFLNVIIWPNQNLTKQTTQKRITIKSSIPSALHAVLPTMVWGASVYGFYTYIGTGLERQGYRIDEIAFTISCYGIGAVIGSLTGGRLSDVFGSKRVANTSLFLLGAMLIIISLSLGTRYLDQLLLAMFAFFGYAFFPSYQHLLSEKYSKYMSTFMAWNNSALYAGITFGSAIGGYIMKGFDFVYLPVFMGVLAIFGAIYPFNGK